MRVRRLGATLKHRCFCCLHCRWNFYSKFLVDRDGIPIARYASTCMFSLIDTYSPTHFSFEEGKATWDDIGKAVEEALKKEKSKL